jgi:hypothetical protein
MGRGVRLEVQGLASGPEERDRHGKATAVAGVNLELGRGAVERRAAPVSSPGPGVVMSEDWDGWYRDIEPRQPSAGERGTPRSPGQGATPSFTPQRGRRRLAQ